MASITKQEERKHNDPPVKLIANVEDLALEKLFESSSSNNNKCANEMKINGQNNDRKSKESTKKAIIVEKSTGAPLVTARSRRSIMESRFRLTLKTWDDVWRSTSWAKNPPKQLKLAAIEGAPAVISSDAAAYVQLPSSNSIKSDTVEKAKVTINSKPHSVVANEVETAEEAVVTEEESVRKIILKRNMNDCNRDNNSQISYVSNEDSTHCEKKVFEDHVITTAVMPVEEHSTMQNNIQDTIEESTHQFDSRSDAKTNIDASNNITENQFSVHNAKLTVESGTTELIGKKIKNTRFMVVPNVQIPLETAETGLNDYNRDYDRASEKDASGTAASSDSEDNQNAASRTRVPMFESRLNELTMVESQLKKLDFKPPQLHLELPEDRDSDDSANSKTITVAEGKTMKIKDALPPRRNNSLEGTYPTQSKKKQKSDVKPSWGWLSIFRRKQSSQQMGANVAVATNATTSTSTTSSTSSNTATQLPKQSPSRKQTRTAASATTGATSHQSRSRQPQRHTTTVASARRAAAQQQAVQANARIVLIQVIRS